jgi:hypothetical protein
MRAVGFHRCDPPATGQEDGGDVAAHEAATDDGGVLLVHAGSLGFGVVVLPSV